MSDIPDGVVHMAVTSPPYFGLRNYSGDEWSGGDPSCAHVRNKDPGHTTQLNGTRHKQGEGVYRSRCPQCGAQRNGAQIGCEDSPSEYLERLRPVFAELHRVVRPGGSLFLNLGDTYFGDSPTRVTHGEKKSVVWNPEDTRSRGGSLRSAKSVDGLKPKDLCLVPFEVAKMLRGDGWWLRDVIIWFKTNPSPSSVDDRCTPSYEFVFHLAKGMRYFADMVAVRSRYTEETIARLGRNHFGAGKDHDAGTNPNRSAHQTFENVQKRLKTAQNPRASGLRQPPEPGEENAFHPMGANLRNVWVIPTEPYSDTRYECPKCGRFFVTQEKIQDRLDPAGVALLKDALANGGNAEEIDAIRRDHRLIGQPDFRCRDCGEYVEKDSHFATFPLELVSRCIRIGSSEAGACRACGEPQRRSESGFESSCTCNAGTEPCLVIDPFMGSGTTAQAAIALGRDYCGYEIASKYHDLIAERIRQARAAFTST